MKMGCTMGKMARRVFQIGRTMGKMIKNVFFEGFFGGQKNKNRALPTANLLPNLMKTPYWKKNL